MKSWWLPLGMKAYAGSCRPFLTAARIRTRRSLAMMQRKSQQTQRPRVHRHDLFQHILFIYLVIGVDYEGERQSNRRLFSSSSWVGGPG